MKIKDINEALWKLNGWVYDPVNGAAAARPWRNDKLQMRLPDEDMNDFCGDHGEIFDLVEKQRRRPAFCMTDYEGELIKIGVKFLSQASPAQKAEALVKYLKLDKPQPAEKKKPVKVVFRTYPGGGVIALFPTVPNCRQYCQSYMGRAEHSGATFAGAHYEGVIRQTRPATPEEYQATHAELEDRGFDLIIAARAAPGDFDERMKEAMKL